MILSDQDWLTDPGQCGGDPCEAQYVVHVTYNEPCQAPCDSNHCCKSGVLRFEDQGSQVIGFLTSGSDDDFIVYNTCPCSEGDEHRCILRLDIECQELGSYYYLMQRFGYVWKCLQCG